MTHLCIFFRLIKVQDICFSRMTRIFSFLYKIKTLNLIPIKDLRCPILRKGISNNTVARQNLDDIFFGRKYFLRQENLDHKYVERKYVTSYIFRIISTVCRVVNTCSRIRCSQRQRSRERSFYLRIMRDYEAVFNRWLAPQPRPGCAEQRICWMYLAFLYPTCYITSYLLYRFVCSWT